MKDKMTRIMPRARTEGLIVEELPDEVLVYDRDRSRAHCLNKAAALVWESCDGKTPISEVALSLRKQLNADFNEETVVHALTNLHKAHLLDRLPKEVLSAAGMSRRSVIAKLGLAAALVTTIVAPAAAVAASHCTVLASGSSSTKRCDSHCDGCCCSNGRICQSGLCKGNSCAPKTVNCPSSPSW
jgi:hypothetical protein